MFTVWELRESGQKWLFAKKYCKTLKLSPRKFLNFQSKELLQNPNTRNFYCKTLSIIIRNSYPLRPFNSFQHFYHDGECCGWFSWCRGCRGVVLLVESVANVVWWSGGNVAWTGDRKDGRRHLRTNFILPTPRTWQWLDIMMWINVGEENGTW